MLTLSIVAVFLGAIVVAPVYSDQTVDIASYILYGDVIGSTCGVRGTLSHASIITTFTVANDGLDTLTYCANACLSAQQSSNCLAYYSNEATRTCRLYNKTLAQMGFTKKTASSGPKYYGSDCFDIGFSSTIRTIVTQDGTSYDDESFPVTFPFPINFYKAVNYTSGYMNINGFLSFGQAGTSSYSNQPLPTYNSAGTPPSQYLPENSIAVYWDDLNIEGLNAQCNNCLVDRRLEMNVMGVAPSRRAVFTWAVTKRDSSGTVRGGVDIDLKIYESASHVYNFLYRSVDNSRGAEATIGVQSKLVNKFAQYTYNTANAVAPGGLVVINTEDNSLHYSPP